MTLDQVVATVVSSSGRWQHRVDMTLGTGGTKALADRVKSDVSVIGWRWMMGYQRNGEAWVVHRYGTENDHPECGEGSPAVRKTARLKLQLHAWISGDS